MILYQYEHFTFNIYFKYYFKIILSMHCINTYTIGENYKSSELETYTKHKLICNLFIV